MAASPSLGYLSCLLSSDVDCVRTFAHFVSMMYASAVSLALIVSQAMLVAGQLAKVYTSCKESNVVALTFDDGPYIYEKKLATTLKNAGIKSTFFVNGNNWECIYDQAMVESIQAAYADGHEFGSHTWHHYDLTTLPWDGTGGIHDEMWRTELALQRILGVSPALMRPPYGNYNSEVQAAAFLRNQSLINWDFDDGDSTGSTAAESKNDYTNIANQHPKNILALNHETYQSSVEVVVPFAITTLRNKGYTFATVSECLGIPPYQWTASPQTRTSDWNCDI